MVRTTPFHERTAALNETGLWEHWANHLVATRYQGDPRAPWYAYGTVAMPAGTMRPGKLNAELDREATS